MLIVNEWTKLRTVRGPWLIVGIQQVVIVAGVSGLAAAGTDLTTRTGVRSLLAHAGIASAILSLVLGITAVAGEYRHRSITDTYLATPTRTPVIMAKLAAYVAVGTGLGVLSAGVGLATTMVWTSARNGTLTLDAQAWRILAGVVAINALYAAIGVSLGALVRNLTAAVTAALVWIALVETTVANLLGGLGQWLPNRAGMAVDGMPAGTTLLPQWTAAVVLAGYATVFAVAALSTTVRRDVT